MEYSNTYEGIDDYAVKLVKFKARQLSGRYGYTRHDIPDLEQELMADLHQRLGKYDPGRAKKNTFIARIVEHKIASLIEERTATKRDYRAAALSLNTETGDQDGNTVELWQLLDEEGRLPSRKRGAPAEKHSSDLRLDIQRAMATLPPELRELCRLLVTKTPNEIARDSGISRATLYDRLSIIRERFEDEGLRDYL